MPALSRPCRLNYRPVASENIRSARQRQKRRVPRRFDEQGKPPREQIDGAANVESQGGPLEWCGHDRRPGSSGVAIRRSFFVCSLTMAASGQQLQPSRGTIGLYA